MKAVAVLPTQLMRVILSSRKTSMLMSRILRAGSSKTVKDCFAISQHSDLCRIVTQERVLELCDGEGYLHGDGGVRQRGRNC